MFYFILYMDASEIVKRIIKYLVEGGAVAVAAYYIPQKKMSLEEIALIAITAAAIFAVLDLFAPAIGIAVRQGAGFGIGASHVGYTGIAVPPIPAAMV
ncbi:MAG: hypothetical protein ACYCOU_01485 [Sulfobacillus sp.]